VDIGVEEDNEEYAAVEEDTYEEDVVANADSVVELGDEEGEEGEMNDDEEEDADERKRKRM
jgi:hypothetical protein